MPVYYPLAWNKDKIDLNDLAQKRWGDRWAVDKLASHFGWGRTLVVRILGQIKANPDLIEDGAIRSRIKSRKYRLMGSNDRMVEGEDDV